MKRTDTEKLRDIVAAMEALQPPSEKYKGLTLARIALHLSRIADALEKPPADIRLADIFKNARPSTAEERKDMAAAVAEYLKDNGPLPQDRTP